MSYEYEEESSDELDLTAIDVDPVTGKIVDATSTPALFAPAPQENHDIRFSVSLIEDYTKCPAKAYARITRQPSEKSISLVLGIAVHEAFEKLFKERKNPKETYARAFEREAELNKIMTSG